MYPKKIQYIAAMIDAGIEAKSAPNFPSKQQSTSQIKSINHIS